MHGIRWRESTHRAAKNLLLSWRARCTHLLEEAETEVGLKLTILSSPEAFDGITFYKKTDGGIYGAGNKTFMLKVVKPLGKVNGVDMFRAQYMKVLGAGGWARARACKGELEEFSKGDLLAYLLDASDKKERLCTRQMRAELLLRLTRFDYVVTLAFWVDATLEGKKLSKLFQTNNLLLSEVTSGIEDSVSSIQTLDGTSGKFMEGFTTDFDSANETLFGIELSHVADGKSTYSAMLTNVTKGVASHISNRFVTLLTVPIIKAACIFEHLRWPSFSSARAAVLKGLIFLIVCHTITAGKELNINYGNLKQCSEYRDVSDPQCDSGQ